MLPENLLRLHSGEEFIRSKSIEAIERSPDLVAHIEMIEASMDSLDYFARSHKAINEDELTLQLLLIRLFNATASALKLAMAGYYQNSALIQRDMLETIFLLDYFTIDVKLIAQWRSADKKNRLKLFKPAFVRETLDKRDGFTTKKRARAYDLLCELAGHATYDGFRMLTPIPGGQAHCGPFFEVTSLDALISELAKHCAQTSHAPQKYFVPTKRSDVEAKILIIENQRRWATRFFGSTFDNSDVARLRSLMQGLQ